MNMVILGYRVLVAIKHPGWYLSSQLNCVRSTSVAAKNVFLDERACLISGASEASQQNRVTYWRAFAWIQVVP